MLDDLRNAAANPPELPPDQTPPPGYPPRQRRGGTLLGMTPGQRFVLVLLLFMMSCVMGIACLVLTGKVYLPFF